MERGGSVLARNLAQKLDAKIAVVLSLLEKHPHHF